MVLVDTAIWIDHFRPTDPRLYDLLKAKDVLMHQFVIGELTLGNLRDRTDVLETLGDRPQAVMATDAEVLRFIERNTLFGTGIGYIDASLLASTRLTRGASLWTRDKRLHSAARRPSLDAGLSH